MESLEVGGVDAKRSSMRKLRTDESGELSRKLEVQDGDVVFSVDDPKAEALPYSEQLERESVELKEDIEKMPTKERRNFLSWVAKFGILLNREKAQRVVKVMDWAEKYTIGNEDLHDIVLAFKASYKEDEKRTLQQEETLFDSKTGKVRKVVTQASGIGSLLSWGRIIADLHVTSPLRSVTAAAVAAGRVGNILAFKRFINKELRESTRDDQSYEAAYNEAWDAYNEAAKLAGNKGIVKFKDGKVQLKDKVQLETVFRRNLPKEILARLESGEIGTFGLVQTVMRKNLEWSIGRIMKKMDVIENDSKLSLEHKEQKKDALLLGFKQLLADADKIVTQSGTVDTVAFFARKAETGAKIVTAVMAVETGIQLFKKGFKMLGALEGVAHAEAVGPMKIEGVEKLEPDESVSVIHGGMTEAELDSLGKSSLGKFESVSSGQEFPAARFEVASSGQEFSVPVTEQTGGTSQEVFGSSSTDLPDDMRSKMPEWMLKDWQSKSDISIGKNTETITPASGVSTDLPDDMRSYMPITPDLQSQHNMSIEPMVTSSDESAVGFNETPPEPNQTIMPGWLEKEWLDKNLGRLRQSEHSMSVETNYGPATLDEGDMSFMSPEANASFVPVGAMKAGMPDLKYILGLTENDEVTQVMLEKNHLMPGSKDLMTVFKDAVDGEAVTTKNNSVIRLAKTMLGRADGRTRAAFLQKWLGREYHGDGASNEVFDKDGQRVKFAVLEQQALAKMGGSKGLKNLIFSGNRVVLMQDGSVEVIQGSATRVPGHVGSELSGGHRDGKGSVMGGKLGDKLKDVPNDEWKELEQEEILRKGLPISNGAGPINGTVSFGKVLDTTGAYSDKASGYTGTTKTNGSQSEVQSATETGPRVDVIGQRFSSLEEKFNVADHDLLNPKFDKPDSMYFKAKVVNLEIFKQALEALGKKRLDNTGAADRLRSVMVGLFRDINKTYAIFQDGKTTVPLKGTVEDLIGHLHMSKIPVGDGANVGLQMVGGEVEMSLEVPKNEALEAKVVVAVMKPDWEAEIERRFPNAATQLTAKQAIISVAQRLFYGRETLARLEAYGMGGSEEAKHLVDMMRGDDANPEKASIELFGKDLIRDSFKRK